MAVQTLTANGRYKFEIGQNLTGYRILTYGPPNIDRFANPSGYASALAACLGGGTLRIFANMDGVVTPVADSKLSASVVDQTGDQTEQIAFMGAGTIIVELSGATNPNVVVSVQ